jgi:hypothetical protein
VKRRDINKSTFTPRISLSKTILIHINWLHAAAACHLIRMLQVMMSWQMKKVKRVLVQHNSYTW